MKYRKFAALIAVPLTAAGIAAGLTGTAHAATPVTSSTASTTLHQRPDSGFGGNTWAEDNLVRVSSATNTGPDFTLTDCGAAATSCFTYTGEISDTGTAFAKTGAISPGAQAIPIKGTPKAAVVGGSDVTFHASAASPDSTLVPTAFTGDGPVSTTDWVEQFFPAGTTFGADPVLTNWSWKYTDTADCQTWTDAFNILKGDSGDITGVGQCTAAPLPVKLFAGQVVAGSLTPAHAVLAWKAAPAAAKYKAVMNGPGFINRTNTVSQTEAVYTGLKGGHTYKDTLTPENADGSQAGPSGVITVITP